MFKKLAQNTLDIMAVAMAISQIAGSFYSDTVVLAVELL
jgi:hypothetical protein